MVKGLFRRRSILPRARRGGAVLELAICLPALTTIVFGSIEASNVIYLKQTLTVIAYEGALRVTKPGGDADAAQERCEEILTARKIAQGEVTISPDADPATPRGTVISVTVTAPANANALGPSWFYGSLRVKSTVCMMRL